MEQIAPIGGEWDWNGDGAGSVPVYGYNVAIHNAPFANRVLFDRLIDDDDFTTGDYRREGPSILRPISPQ